MKFVKTRIAPTPSGFLHIGNVLSFSLTAGLARQAGASILLRIDDLDRERFAVEYLEDIFETLRFLGIPWDEGPRDVEDFEKSWSQVHRMGLYERALGVLRESGAVFACNCSRAQLVGSKGYPGTCREKGISLDADGVNWRLRTEGRESRAEGRGSWTEESGSWADGREAWAEGSRSWVEGNGLTADGSNLRTEGSGLPVEMRDFVVRRKDGYPAYQLSSVVDDLYYNVDLVVRGEDLRASTEAQLYLAKVLGAEEFGRVQFVHHPLLLENGEKLSKSAGATSIQYLRKQGYSAADVFSLIARSLESAEPVRDWQSAAKLLFARGYGVDR